MKSILFLNSSQGELLVTTGTKKIVIMSNYLLILGLVFQSIIIL
jgi:hypothetical protein